jgi:hypothetical protein
VETVPGLACGVHGPGCDERAADQIIEYVIGVRLVEQDPDYPSSEVIGSEKCQSPERETLTFRESDITRIDARAYRHRAGFQLTELILCPRELADHDGERPLRPGSKPAAYDPKSERHSAACMHKLCHGFRIGSDPVVTG